MVRYSRTGVGRALGVDRCRAHAAQQRTGTARGRRIINKANSTFTYRGGRCSEYNKQVIYFFRGAPL